MNNKTNDVFEILGPSEDSDISTYKNALDFAFYNKKIKNIAITGNFGSGKSSLLKSYINKECINSNDKIFPELASEKEKLESNDFMYVSLANFEEEKKIEINSNDDNSLSLEGKIINQIIQQIDSKNIPQTRFKTKQNISVGKIWIYAVTLALSFALVIINLNYSSWINIITNLLNELSLDFEFLTSERFHILTIVILLLIFTFYIKTLIKLQLHNQLFKKIAGKGFEIEVFEEKEESYFDRYLNEVLYLFRNSNKKVFVFEDLDRFNDNSIFVKLREINALLNNQVKGKTIKFIYMLKDDSFASKDRTKFFDFIIPVIPVVDGNNSFELIKKRIEKMNLEKRFNFKFLQEISLYIDEYRLLKNILNEFNIYCQKLNNIDLDYNKLFAMIVYKNIFPKDFSELQLNAGYVGLLFKNKTTLIEDRIEAIRNEKEEIEKELEINSLNLENSIDELDALYVVLPQITQIRGKRIRNNETYKELIKEIKANNYEINDNSTRSYGSNVKGLFDKLQHNEQYLERLEVLQKGKEKHESMLLNQIALLNEEVQKLSFENLSQLLTRDNKESFFNLKFMNVEDGRKYSYIINSDYFGLLKYIISNGYINEMTYFDYMSYFYPNSISQNDKKYLRSLTDQISLDSMYFLDSPTEVINRISDKYFNEIEILNYHLVLHLLSSNNSNITNVMNVIRENNCMEFISLFYKENRNIGLMSRNLLLDNNFIERVIDSHLIEKEIKEKIVLCAILYTESRFSTKVVEYISKCEKILEKETIEFGSIGYSKSHQGLKDSVRCGTERKSLDNTFIDRLKELEVEFDNIDFVKSNKYLLKEVYINHRYSLTMKHVKQMLNEFYNIPNDNIINNKNLSLVFSDPNQPLYFNVLSKINEYVKILLDETKDKFIDEEKYVIDFLNLGTLDIELKIKYIERLETKLENLSLILENKLWNVLLTENKIAPTTKNIVAYYEKNGLNDRIVQYINNQNQKIELDFGKDAKDFDENLPMKMYQELMACNEINIMQYDSIFSNCPMSFNSISTTYLDSEKIDVLIKNHIIEMNLNTLSFFRKNYVECINDFIDSNSSEYIELINNSTFIYDEMIHSLTSPSFSDEQRARLMSFTSRTIEFNDDFSDLTKECVINSHLDSKDYQLLSSLYIKQSDDIRVCIREKYVKDINVILKNSIQLSSLLLKDIYNNEKLEERTWLQLFEQSIDGIEYKDIMMLFNNVNVIAFNGIAMNKNPVMEKNYLNEQILKKLKSKRVISSFVDDKKQTNFYRIYTLKKQK